jgi:protein-S-isoprenylcysteine O-methyltransferase Ste14
MAPIPLTLLLPGVFLSIVNVLAAVSIAVCWVVFVAVWLITANYNETRAPAQRQRSWYGTGVVPVVIISTMIRLVVPPADWLPVTFYAPWARFLGLAILLAATGLTLWARFVLGLMWSAAPAVKEGHQLRTSGPYTITRHPIYTGLLGMMLGTMLLAGIGPWIVPFPIALILIEVQNPHRGTVHDGRIPRRLSPLPQAGATAGARPSPGLRPPGHGRLVVTVRRIELSAWELACHAC